MKRWVIVFGLVAMAGCSQLEGYVENPPSMLRDPHFAQYQEKQENLEKAFLHKEMSYSDYLQKKKQLEDQYTKEIEQRRDLIETDQTKP